LEERLNGQQSALEQGFPKVAKPLEQMATAIAGEPKVSGALLDAIDRVREAIDRAAETRLLPNPLGEGVQGPCFNPDFRVGSNQLLRNLRARAESARTRWAIPDGSQYRVVTNQLVFFDTDRPELSDGAKASITQFLGRSPLGSLALSVRALA